MPSDELLLLLLHVRLELAVRDRAPNLLQPRSALPAVSIECSGIPACSVAAANRLAALAIFHFFLSVDRRPASHTSRQRQYRSLLIPPCQRQAPTPVLPQTFERHQPAAKEGPPRSRPRRIVSDPACLCCSLLGSICRVLLRRCGLPRTSGHKRRRQSHHRVSDAWGWQLASAGSNMAPSPFSQR